MSDQSNTSSIAPIPTLLAEAKRGLRDFFQQKSVKNLVGVLVPSVLAAVLYPVFGPAIAAGAAAVAIQNGLKLLGISLSVETIGKILKPLEGKQIEESDIHDILQEILPQDKQVNDEAAKVLITILPEVREAALTNSKVDLEWLGISLEGNLQQQGGTLAIVAPQISDLIQMDKAIIEEKVTYLLKNWSSNIQEVTAREYSKITKSEQSIEGKSGTNRQLLEADDHSEIVHLRQNMKFT